MKRYASLLIAFTLVLAALLLGGCGNNKGLEYTLIDGSYYEVSGIGTCTDTEIYIPAEYNGLPVKSIGKGAFYLCSSLTSITIPDSITSIGSTAFLGCSSLTYNVHDNAKYLGNKQNPYMVLIKATDTSITSCEIHAQTKIIVDGALGGAFNGCSSLTSITIPDSVTSIGSYAFAGCSSLTSITIPDSVTSIVKYAFSGCSSLTNITIPDSVTSIGEDAFEDCSSLIYNMYDNAKYLGNEQKLYVALIKVTDTSITSCEIHAQTKIIADYAFYDCNSLTDITIPNSVTSIGYNAFWDCDNLTNVTIGNSVKSIGDSAFYGCSNLTGVYITDLAKWCQINFSDHNSNPLTYARNLYLNGTLVTKLVIPNGVTSIGKYAFEKCDSLTSITIPDSVTSIGYEAFYDCDNLTSITISNSVTSIDENAFENCGDLTGVYITDIAKWCQISFSNFKSNPLYNAHNLYLNGTLVTELVIPDSVTSIGENAFYDCYSLTSITIPNSVTSIGDYAFSYCSNLKTVTFTGTQAQWDSIPKDATGLIQSEITVVCTG